MLCRSAAAACSLRLAAGTEGAAADSLQSLLVLSSDTFPPPTTAAAHKCPPSSTSLLSSSSPPAALPLPSTSQEALGIWKLTLTVCCFRERASCFAMFWVAGEGMGLCLAFLASLILSSSKQGHQTARRTDKKPK